MVSITLTCHPASAMFGPVCACMSVGLYRHIAIVNSILYHAAAMGKGDDERASGQGKGKE